MQREVGTRYLSKDGTAGAERAYVFSHDGGDAGRACHWWTMLDDPDGQSEKAWWFQTDASQFNFGLVTAHEARLHHYPVTAGSRHEDYTWTTEAAGNRYIAAVLTTEDMGNPGQAQKKVEQTRDAYGNVTQTKVYNYGNLTTPARTYTNTYVADANYTSRYIRNRLAASTVTDGSATTTLVSNLYDGGCPYASLAAMTNAREHDDANYGQTFFYRGNVTQSTTPAGVTCTSYNTGGAAVSTTRNGVQTSITVNSSTNYAAPSALTTNSLTETLQWNAFLGLTQETGPNGDTTALLYDAYARLAQTTSPTGAATTHTYLTTPGATTSTTNGHWTKKTLDGLGRVIKVEAGYGSTTVSQTDTEYDSCGCSPLGKMKRASMPHAPNASVYWTTYNYDGLGRTVSVASADGASTKTYAYSGNTVTVTDEAGKWKKYTMDAMGNVVRDVSSGFGRIEQCGGRRDVYVRV